MSRPAVAVALAIWLGALAAGCGADSTATRPEYAIAFTAATATGGQALFLADRDGEQVLRVGADDADVRSPAWSPDGQEVAYAECGSSEQGRCSLYTVEAPGGKPQELGEGAWPQWAPDGQRLAFVKPRGTADELFVTDSEQDAPRLKTAGLDDAGSGGGIVGSSVNSWSPDGRELAVTRRLEGGEGSEVLLVRADGLRESRLGAELEAAAFAGWSPDGSQMLLTGRGRDGGEGLYVVGSDGTGLRRLLPVDRLEGTRAAWSPDGRQVLASTSDDALMLVDVASGEARPIASGACIGAGGLAWGDANSAWYTRGCEGGGRALIELDPGSGVERTLPVEVIEFAWRAGG